MIRRLILVLAAALLGCAPSPCPAARYEALGALASLVCDELSCTTSADCPDPAKPVCRGGYCQAER